MQLKNIIKIKVVKIVLLYKLNFIKLFKHYNISNVVIHFTYFDGTYDLQPILQLFYLKIFFFTCRFFTCRFELIMTAVINLSSFFPYFVGIIIFLFSLISTPLFLSYSKGPYFSVFGL